MESKIPVVMYRPGVIEKTNILCGNCELIDSRSVILFDSNEPVEIEEIFNSTFKIRIRIFNDRNETGEHSIQVSVDQNQNLIEYKCFNFDNVLGTGTNKAIEIGSFGGKKMYIHFWIYAMGEGSSLTRKLEYSIWKEC